MSDLLAVSKVKATGIVPGTAPSPDISTEAIHSEISNKSSSSYQQHAVTFDSPLSGNQGESFLPTASLIAIEKPKGGLTKTKKNLKKQLFLKKAAAQDDGRQTPNLPSPNHCSEDGNTEVICTLNINTSTTYESATDLPVIKAVESGHINAKERISDVEEQSASVTVKIETVDSDDFTSSSTSVCSVTTPMHTECTADKMTASEDLCPSPNETISQSGTEIAGPTKWIIGDMLWARVSGHPWWPCMVAYDPTHTAFTRTLKRRQGTLVQYHVQFFGDEGERGWINEGSIIPYEGVEAFNKFCDEMKVLHKKDRQNYVVPPRRAKAWNVAVRSAEEAYPMTRVFRVHRFAFVYDQPVVANGSMIVAENRFDSGQQGTKCVKRSRSSSLGDDGRPRKRRRMSGEKNLTNADSMTPKTYCFSLNNRTIGQVNQENSLACEGASPEIGSTVFRSRAEGVKRSSRFVKPTNRIMEHMEEVQQRRRIKLRPYHRVIGPDAVADHSTEEVLGDPKSSELLSTPTEEVSNEIIKKQANEMNDSRDCRDEMMEISFTEDSEHLQKSNTSSFVTLDRTVDSVSSFNMIYPCGLIKENVPEVVSLTNLINSATTESHDALNKDVKSEVDETVLNLQSSESSSLVSKQLESEKSSLSMFLQKILEDEVGLNHQRNVPTDASNNQKKLPEETEVNFREAEVNFQEASVPEGLPHSEKEKSNCELTAVVNNSGNNHSECELTGLHAVNTSVGLDMQTDPVEIMNSEQKMQKRKYKRTKNLPSNDPQNVMSKKVRVRRKKNLTTTTEADTISTVSSPLELLSVMSSSPTKTKQRKLPGKRKPTVGPDSQTSNAVDFSSSETTTAEVNGILICSPSKSLTGIAPHCPAEFQRLNSAGPHKSEEVCHICEQSGDVLIDCQGPCFGSYHLSCLGLTVSPVGSFRCDECSTGNHPCFVCKHTSRDTVACSVSKCGRFYHRECINKFPLSKVDSNCITCPLHICATCAAETGKNGRANKGPMYRCIRCPTAYHANDYCIAAGTVEIAGYNIICNSHLLSSKSPKRGLAHINATWCFVCSKDGGHLTLCSSCPAAFHASCAKINQTTDVWQCKDCIVGKRPLYGEVVWAKVGNYRWWPGEVCHFRNSLVESANKAGCFAVRLFGLGFQFWLQQGRVFPFRENDRLSHESVYRTLSERFEKAVSEAAEVYMLRLAARDGKTNSDKEKNDQKPAHYKHIKTNMPLGDVEIYKVAPSEILCCHCSPTMENPCGPDSDCINRLMMYECNALVCPAGENCLNQRFQKREDSDVRPYKTEQRGWGLRNRSDIKKGQFIAEYVGDLVDPDECNRRLEYAQQHNITNFYMLTLDKNRIIDAGPKGNYSRFMNHSCEPNCETQKWTVNGDIRVGLFALHDIPAGSELTFNYNLDCYGNQKTVCKCGSSICSGFLGVRPKTTAAANVEKKLREAKLKKHLKEIKSKDRPDICYACKKRGGEMVICENSDCLKSYHRRCIKPFNHNEGKFMCPLHKCDACYLDALKPCSICPRSFCLLHVNGNIFEISDGSLVCSKHQDIINCCLQDGWISSNQDGNSVGSNGISSAQIAAEMSCGTSDNILPDEKNLVRKQSEVNSKNSANAKVMRRRKTEAGACVRGATSEAEPKKRGRPLKMALNGSVDKRAKTTTAEQIVIDNNHLTTKNKKSTVNRRSKEKSKSSDEKTSLESSTSGKRNCNAKSTRGANLQLGEKALKASVTGGVQSIETLDSNLPAISASKTDVVEILSQTNNQSHLTVDFDKSLGLISDGSTQEQFSPLVLEESF